MCEASLAAAAVAVAGGNVTKSVFLSALADFFITASGVVTGAMMQQGAVVMPTYPVLILAGVSGLVMFWQHVKAHYSKVPA